MFPRERRSGVEGKVHSLDLFMFDTLSGILRTVLLATEEKECYCGGKYSFYSLRPELWL